MYIACAYIPWLSLLSPGQPFNRETGPHVTAPQSNIMVFHDMPCLIAFHSKCSCSFETPQIHRFTSWQPLPHLGVSVNGGTPKSSIFSGVFPYKPIHCWVPPFQETSISCIVRSCKIITLFLEIPSVALRNFRRGAGVSHDGWVSSSQNRFFHFTKITGAAQRTALSHVFAGVKGCKMENADPSHRETMAVAYKLQLSKGSDSEQSFSDPAYKQYKE